MECEMRGTRWRHMHNMKSQREIRQTHKGLASTTYGHVSCKSKKTIINGIVNVLEIKQFVERRSTATTRVAIQDHQKAVWRYVSSNI
jgi:hypothetical protein